MDPWGGEGGGRWTDGTYSGIKSITVRHGDVIDAIQVEYHLKGETKDNDITAPQHGGNGGTATRIELAADEELIKVEGYAGNYRDINTITSLKFTTNQRVSGPFGTDIVNYFKSDPNGKIVGFYGHSGIYLDSLGIYAQVSK
ncbi:hypothetical protein SUGI_1107370 [Cryptomeria japonica]|uniref:jacalin-related lectin 3-like n=1 Tax=Cryptomeria japonica TaxID=3369 RepID=UPI002414B371|nr:jacalin-related lectin 3-like [Cryptomeria japonica]GLJ52069.1 hypothetical protein SUGI_1107370 [Cryptomeria japonica]